MAEQGLFRFDAKLTSLVEDLKGELARQDLVPAADQRLTCNGRDLVCGRTLAQCGVHGVTHRCDDRDWPCPRTSW